MTTGMDALPELPELSGRRVIAAMSGGVDSSVMAALLRDAGAEVIGVFLNVWEYRRDEAAGHGSCCSLEDAYDARRVADHLGIPFYNIDMRETFRRDVIDPFIEDYGRGRTPNPCARCNRFVKFGALLELADRLDADFVATGHYVRRRDDADGLHILRGEDPVKDQSYFLATTTPAAMRRLLFPVGSLTKETTRALAKKLGLPTAAKRESQDICFIPDGDRIAFLRREGGGAGLRPGEIVDPDGRRLGTHPGIAHFTLGQRRGLGLAGGPWHVVGLDGERARVIVARPEQAKACEVTVRDLNWLRRPQAATALEVKLRYRMRPVRARVLETENGVRVLPEEAVAPTAPGQVAAFYRGEELIGGGLIDEVRFGAGIPAGQPL